MSMRTKGDLCGMTVRDEQEYGKVDTSGQSAYAGTLVSLSINDERETDTIGQCGSMVRAGIIEVARKCDFKAVFNQVRGTGWEKWLIRALGASSGTSRDLPSFDTSFRVAAGEHHLCTGCVMDTVTMSATNIGSKVELSAQAVCRWHTMTPFEDADGSSITFPPVEVPYGLPLTFNSLWQYSTDGGSSWTPIKTKGFTLTISRSLQSDPGVSGDGIRLEAGEGSVPQDIKITLDLTITSTGPEWDAKRLAAMTDDFTLKLTLDSKTITLRGCVLGIKGPDRTQASYDETISFDAADMTVV